MKAVAATGVAVVEAVAATPRGRQAAGSATVVLLALVAAGLVGRLAAAAGAASAIAGPAAGPPAHRPIPSLTRGVAIAADPGVRRLEAAARAPVATVRSAPEVPRRRAIRAVAAAGAAGSARTATTSSGAEA